MLSKDHLKPERWGQLCHLEAQTSSGEKFGIPKPGGGLGKGKVNVTRVCASVSITIGSSLFVGGILLVSVMHFL